LGHSRRDWLRATIGPRPLRPENGDIGFCVADRSIAGKAPDAKDVKVGGTSAEVVKKTSGGNGVL
jgi:hypothetical protein